MSDAGQDIPGKWADNFEDLASPGSEYDRAFADSIKDLFSKILQEPVSSCASITVEEGNDAIMSLKAKKVSGNDEVDVEHLIFGDFHPEEPSCSYVLVSGDIPSLFQLGIAIPIPNGHDNNLSVPNNYRGI